MHELLLEVAVEVAVDEVENQLQHRERDRKVGEILQKQDRLYDSERVEHGHLEHLKHSSEEEGDLHAKGGRRA